MATYTVNSANMGDGFGRIDKDPTSVRVAKSLGVTGRLRSGWSPRSYSLSAGAGFFFFSVFCV